MAFCLLNKQTFQIREKKNCAFSGALHSTVVWESHTIKKEKPGNCKHPKDIY